MNHDTINKFLEIVRELEEEHNHATYNSLKEEWITYSMKELHLIIDKMKRDGNIYAPKRYRYKVV